MAHEPVLQSFTRDGLVFDVVDGGPTDGEPVVLLHGFPQDSSAWDRVAPLLHDAGLRTLAPDQRGYSPGACPPGRAAYRMPELVRDVLALLDAAGLYSAHIVGHDWGAGVAWMMAARSPDRVRSLTVLSTPHPAAMVWAMTHSTQALKSWYMFGFQLPWVPERLLAGRLGQVFARSGLPAEDASRYGERLRSPGDLTGPLAWYRAMPPIPRLRGRGHSPAPAKPPSPGPSPSANPPKPPSSGGIGVPTTFVWGSRDSALGRAAAVRTARHVRAPYRFVELDASHWLPETEPERVAGEIIDRVTDRAAP